MPTDSRPGVSYAAPATDFRIEPAQESRRNRSLAIACAALAAVAVLGLLWLLIGRGGRAEEAQGGASTTASSIPLPEQARTAYAPPSQAQVARAAADVGRTYRAGGASELARASQACFQRLRERPDYAQLDYCLAFDSFAATEISRLAEVDVLPTASWFGQAPQRGFQVAQAVLGPEGDAASRLIDIRRMALGASRGGTAYAQAAPVAPAVLPSGVEPAYEDAGLQVQVQGAPPRATPAPAPAAPASAVQSRPAPAAPPPAVVRRAEAPPASAPAPTRVQQPAPAPVRRAEAAPAPSRPDPRPRAVQPEPRREVARAEGGARPSFNCRYARTRSERLVCGDAGLARLDRDLNRAFESAVASGVSRRALRAEQDSWLAVRESAAGDPQAVADIYALRIEELRDVARDAPPDGEDY